MNLQRNYQMCTLTKYINSLFRRKKLRLNALIIKIVFIFSLIQQCRPEVDEIAEAKKRAKVAEQKRQEAEEEEKRLKAQKEAEEAERLRQIEEQAGKINEKNLFQCSVDVNRILFHFYSYDFDILELERQQELEQQRKQEQKAERERAKKEAGK